MYRSLTTILALIVLCAFSNIACAAEPVIGWSKRGVFVFGDIVLDFEKKFAAAYIFSSGLTDCSNANYYCARSDIVNVVLPRRCSELDTSDSWTVGSTTTKILARATEVVDPIHPSGSGHLLYLGDPAVPYAVYVYDPARGIRELYWDPSKKLDFVSLVRTGKIDAYQQSLRLGQITFHALKTFDPFGVCSGHV